MGIRFLMFLGNWVDYLGIDCDLLGLVELMGAGGNDLQSNDIIM